MERTETLRVNESRITLRLQSETPPDCRNSDAERLSQLGALANVFGAEPTGAVLDMYSQALADLSEEQFSRAITVAIQRLKFFPKPAELRELAGATGSAVDRDAESRKAWEVVIAFAAKWVQSDAEGSYVISRGVRSSEPPQLSQQILDTVRRTGGWRVYKCMTNEDLPFVQKRFFEEYAAWVAVEQIVPGKLLTEMPLRQLIAKPMNPPTIAEKKLPQCAMPAVRPKAIPEPLTEAQLRDRREILRQQVESLKTRGIM